MGRNENPIQRDIIDTLKKLKIPCFRIPAGKYYKGLYLGDNIGAPDIVICLHRLANDGMHAASIPVGQFVGIEIKAKTDQRQTQRDSQKLIESADGEYWIVHSVDELLFMLGF